MNKIYKVLSRNRCELYCTQRHSNTSVIISIKSTYDKVMPNVFCSDTNNVKAILSLSFDDVEAEDLFFQNREYCMTFKDGEKIAAFVKEWYTKVDAIIIHCDAGISRSAGICAAIMQVYEGYYTPIWKNKIPNMTCFLRTLKGFNYI